MLPTHLKRNDQRISPPAYIIYGVYKVIRKRDEPTATYAQLPHLHFVPYFLTKSLNDARKVRAQLKKEGHGRPYMPKVGRLGFINKIRIRRGESW